MQGRGMVNYNSCMMMNFLLITTHLIAPSQCPVASGLYTCCYSITVSKQSGVSSLLPQGTQNIQLPGEQVTLQGGGIVNYNSCTMMNYDANRIIPSSNVYFNQKLKGPFIMKNCHLLLKEQLRIYSQRIAPSQKSAK